MVIVCCECSWDIPGVERLPPHTHFRHARIRHNGRELMVDAETAVMNPSAAVIDQWAGIQMSVDWREVAREISREMPCVPGADSRS